MSRALKFLSSSVGKKLIMGLSGFFLINFLLFHLTINLFLFAGRTGRFVSYSAFLGEYPLLRPIELILFGGFLLHAILGAFVWVMNRRARPRGYKVDRTSKSVKLSSRLSIVTGSVILLFLVGHIAQFFVHSRFIHDGQSMYDLVYKAFTTPLIVVLYELAFLVLGFHLKHGFQAFFQSWGMRSAKYRGFIDAIAVIVWLLVPLAFASIPLVFILGGLQ